MVMVVAQTVTAVEIGLDRHEKESEEGTDGEVQEGEGGGERGEGVVNCEDRVDAVCLFKTRKR